MALRGKRGKDLKKSTRAKILLSGPAGCGKSTLVAQFPRAYIVDTEDGLGNYEELLERSGSHVFKSVDPKEIIAEVRSLMAEPHDFRTFAIDPVTNMWHAQLEEAKAVKGEAFGRHYGEAADQTERLVRLLLRLDMNLVFTAHEKDVYESVQGATVRAETTYDGWKKSHYFFDLWLKLRSEERKLGQARSVVYTGRVAKTRLEGFPPFEELSLGEYRDGEKRLLGYQAIAERFGFEGVERAAESVKLATQEQAAEARALMEAVNPPAEWVEKAFKYAEAGTLEDFSEENIVKYIDKLKTMKG